VERRGDDYFGPALNRARLTAVAHGGQILCSPATADLVQDALVAPVSLVDLGAHRLRDLTRPETIFQVSTSRPAWRVPPLRSLDAFPGNLPIERTTLIGRTPERAKLACGCRKRIWTRCEHCGCRRRGVWWGSGRVEADVAP